jgi:hypothetical protein
LVFHTVVTALYQLHISVLSLHGENIPLNAQPVCVQVADEDERAAEEAARLTAVRLDAARTAAAAEMEATALVTQHAVASNRAAAESAARALREANEALATMSRLASDLATTAKAEKLAHVHAGLSTEAHKLVAPLSPSQPLPAGWEMAALGACGLVAALALGLWAKIGLLRGQADGRASIKSSLGDQRLGRPVFALKPRSSLQGLELEPQAERADDYNAVEEELLPVPKEWALPVPKGSARSTQDRLLEEEKDTAVQALVQEAVAVVVQREVEGEAHQAAVVGAVRFTSKWEQERVESPRAAALEVIAEANEEKEAEEPTTAPAPALPPPTPRPLPASQQHEQQHEQQPPVTQWVEEHLDEMTKDVVELVRETHSSPIQLNCISR